MLTNDDITQIVQAVTNAEKEFLYTKSELDEKFKQQQESFATLQTSMDGLASIFKKYYEEQQIYIHKVKTIEEWIKKAASKLGIDYTT
ncbi:MAG TPA: hypothetical protein VFX17_04490 [Patescibacteria group bacterium]|nr:hypothetical protein [Patescibacteria group bacterium]